ncbi:MAG: hypothetical protein H7Y04_09835 [Verrucomicrobia bacterium]|nr:hypothetical protein [Cytophagales bacterium]
MNSLKSDFSEKLLLGLSILTFLTFLVLFVRMLGSYTAGLSITETNMIYGVTRLLADLPLYIHPTQFPFYITQYSPFFYYECAFFGKIFGVSPDHTHDVHVLIRSVGLLNLMLVTLLGFLTLHKVFEVRKSLAFACSLLALFTVSSIALAYNRVDGAELLFTTATLFFGSYFFKTKYLPWLVLATVCGVLSFFSKQSGMIAVAVVFGFLGYQKLWKILLIQCSVAVLAFFICLFIFVGLNWDSFFANIIGGVVNPIILREYYHSVIKYLFSSFHGSLLVVGLIVAYGNLFSSSIQKKFFAFALFGLVGFDSVTSLKVGSSIHYFFDGFYLSWLILGIKTEQILLRNTFLLVKKQLLGMVSLFLVITGFVVLMELYLHYCGADKVCSGAYFREIEVADYLIYQEKLQPDAYVYVTYFVDSFVKQRLYQNTVCVENIVIFSSVVPLRVFDMTALYQATETGKIKYIITRQGILPGKEPFSDLPIDYGKMNFSKYHLYKTLNGHDIYRWEK